LIDDRLNTDPSSPHPDGECRLYVQVFDAKEEQLVKTQYVEGDLPTLVNRHRTPADVYLRPMLRELGQEKLMLPDVRIARQVLTPAVHVDAAMRRQVENLVGKLDSGDFKERQSATADLKQLG